MFTFAISGFQKANKLRGTQNFTAQSSLRDHLIKAPQFMKNGTGIQKH